MKRVLLLSLFFCSLARAQVPQAPADGAAAAKAKYTPVRSQNAIRINYGYPVWNTDAAKVDSASLIMREGTSGRLVQIHLVESEPDSAMFSGIFSIAWQNLEQMKAEFFIPPQNDLNSNEGLKRIASMITEGKLRRKPFILRRALNGAQTIELFDTRDQAQKALKIYAAEQQLQTTQNKKFPSDQQMATAALAVDLKAKESALAAEAERMRMEQLEAARMTLLKAQEAAMNEAERTRRRNEATTLANEALALFKENKLAEAVEKFEKAVELDPENRGYYFQYGVALYKTDQFNKALVYLRMASGESVNEVERDFFVGLAHFKLKEYDNSLAVFQKVVETKHADMAPAAQFYRGVVYYEQKKWDLARPEFQAVLDTSKDTQLDARAEAYIEQILRLQQFDAEKARKWQISATLGELYDSNVLLSSDSSLSQGSATNATGYRSLLQSSVRYRPVYDEQNEFAIQLDAMTMYTLDKSFKGDQSLRNTDPTVATLIFPWTYKGLMFGKGYKFDVTPGYESIWMSIEDNTTKAIITSYLLSFANLFVMSNTLYSNFNLEFRRDQSNLVSSTGDANSTAIKVKLLNSNLHFLTDDKLKILTTEAALTLNQALGKDEVYNRIDLALGYIRPSYWETNFTAKLGYFWLTYPGRADSRADNSVTGTLGLSKKLSDQYSTGLVANYNVNASNVEASAYKKWTALLTFSALYGL